MQAAVLVMCQGSGLRTIETHANIVQEQCTMTAQGLMDILLENPLHIYILIMTAGPVNWPRIMIVAYASNASKCIICAKGDEMHRLTDECSILTQCENFLHVLLSMPLNISRPVAATSKGMIKPPQNNYTKYRSKTVANTLLYQMRIRHIATNLLACAQSSKACETDTLVRLSRCSTESNSIRRMVDRITQIHLALGGSPENLRSKN